MRPVENFSTPVAARVLCDTQAVATRIGIDFDHDLLVVALSALRRWPTVLILMKPAGLPQGRIDFRLRVQPTGSRCGLGSEIAPFRAATHFLRAFSLSTRWTR